MPHPNIGIWLIGARGGIATTVATGLCGLQKGLTGETGLISGMKPFAALEPAAWGDFLIGGHEIRYITGRWLVFTISSNRSW